MRCVNLQGTGYNKIRKIFQTFCFSNNFFTVKHKKNPALCYRAGFFELLFPTIRIQHCAEYVGKVSHHEYWSYR